VSVFRGDDLALRAADAILVSELPYNRLKRSLRKSRFTPPTLLGSASRVAGAPYICRHRLFRVHGQDANDRRNDLSRDDRSDSTQLFGGLCEFYQPSREVVEFTDVRLPCSTGLGRLRRHPGVETGVEKKLT
jgi:hypothetical protein